MKKIYKILFVLLSLCVIAAHPAFAAELQEPDGMSSALSEDAGIPVDFEEPEIVPESEMETASEWETEAGLEEAGAETGGIMPMSALAPTITVTSIPQTKAYSTVAVQARATTPCYRMSAKYVYNGKETWLGNVNSNSYYKTFMPSSTGTYTVTVYARNYPENHPQSYMSSKTISFTVYSIVYPTVSVNSIANVNPGTSVAVRATSSTPCYRMSAKYTYDGVDTWLGNVSSSSYSKNFTPTKEGYYSVTVYSRSYAESNVRSAQTSKSVGFYVRAKVVPKVTLSSISNTTVGNTVTVSGSSTTPCYRMSASYTHNGVTHWLGDVSSSSYRKTFTPTSAGTYTVTLYARSYAESNVQSAQGSASRTFTVTGDSKTLSVPLYKQEREDTCGSASGRMILKLYGIDVTEEEFREAARRASGIDDDFTMVYAVTKALNKYLSENGKSTSFQYIDTSGYTTQQYTDLIRKNIMNGHPVQAQLKITDTNHFNYTSNGHYVVIKGIQYVSGSYQAVVNDPHPDHCKTLNVPMDKMLSYNKAHSGFVICVNGL